VRRTLIRAAAALAGLVALVAVPSGPAAAEPDCDRPKPPPACVEDPLPPVPQDHPPFGALDDVVYLGNAVRAFGWANDYDSPTAPVSVHLYLDGVFKRALTADGHRPDLGTGSYRGYDTTVPAGPGTHEVCAWAINVAPAGAVVAGNQRIGCRTYTGVPAAPGNVRTLSTDGAGNSVTGFTDNSVDETSFLVEITSQRWERVWDVRYQLWYPQLVQYFRSITVPAHPGTGEVSVPVTAGTGYDCRTKVTAVAGAVRSQTAYSAGSC
jgi:hypothetical protein